MPVPGYDPDDVEASLESALSAEEIEALLSEAELEAYRSGEESLVDLLAEDDIERIVEEGEGPAGGAS